MTERRFPPPWSVEELKTRFVTVPQASASSALMAYIEPRELRVREGSNAMNDSSTLYDEEVLHGDEVPDAAVEIAGSKWGDGAAVAVTAAFCSGLDSCPSSPRK